MTLVSACLLGFECRHDGRAKTNSDVLQVIRDDDVIPVCPEAAAGLGIPREAFSFDDDLRLVGADTSRDATEDFEVGARIATEAATRWSVDRAILKERSPSCGRDHVYVHERVEAGRGVTAAMLAARGLPLFTEGDLPS